MSWGWPVPAGVFPEDQLERLRTFPDIGRDDLIRYFTLTRPVGKVATTRRHP